MTHAFLLLSYCMIFIPTAERAIYAEMLIKEAKAEMEIHPITIETKINLLFDLKSYKTFSCVLLTESFFFISSKKENSCFIYLIQSKFLAHLFNHIFKVDIYFSIKTRIFNTWIDSSSLNIFSSSLPHCHIHWI